MRLLLIYYYHYYYYYYYYASSRHFTVRLLVPYLQQTLYCKTISSVKDQAIGQRNQGKMKYWYSRRVPLSMLRARVLPIGFCGRHRTPINTVCTLCVCVCVCVCVRECVCAQACVNAASQNAPHWVLWKTVNSHELTLYAHKDTNVCA